MTGIVLQARLGSTRLPGKALLPLAGRPSLIYAMEALKLVEVDAYILATEPASAEALEPLARRAGFSVLVGSCDDVLARYCSAARAFGLDTLVRATGDNPLVSFELARLLVRQHLRLDADYSGLAGIAVGSGVEVLKAAALFKAEDETVDAYDHEHVSPYLYRNPDLFFIHRPLVARAYRSSARITVDTPEDLAALEGIFSRLYRGRPIGYRALLRHLRKDARPDA